MPVEPPTRRSTAGLVRPRLLSALRGTRPVPLTIVVAPAGCGKTTLLAHYAQRFAGPVGWLRVEPTDAAPDRLRARVLTALPQPWAVRSASNEQPPALLIIDDLHLIEGSAAEAELDRLLLDAPAGLRVIAASRRLPNLNLSRHELSDVAIVDADQLRFRAWEVDQLLREVYREPLPADDVAALSRRVGGWAAGLQLFHLSTSGRPLAERRQAVAALNGRSTLSRAYLARTVLADLPDELRLFLVRSCVFDVLTADRCDLLLGTTGSQSHLEQLERRQAFTASHDGGRTFRYHEVLRAHLCITLIEDLGDAGAREWHRRAAGILVVEGSTVEAARSYARAEDWVAVRQLLDQVGGTLTADGLESWRDLLPAWLVAEDPWLVLAEGRHRMTHGQLDAAISAFQRAEDMFSAEPARLRCRAARAAATTWLPGGPSTRSHWGSWLRAATRHHPAVVAAEAQQLTDPAAALISTLAYLLAGDVSAAEQVLPQIASDVAADGEHDVAALAGRLLRAAWSVATGDPAGPLELTATAVHADAAYQPWLARIARAAAALDRSEAGVKQARSVMEECDRLNDPWGAAIALGLAQLSQSLTRRCDPDELAELLTRVRALDAAVLLAWVQALLALTAVTGRSPEEEQELRRAESVSRAAGVPGARALTMIAAANASGGRPEQLAPAYASAASVGLRRSVVLAWATGAGNGPAVALAGPVTDAPVSVWCFGSFRLCVDGRPLDWSSIRPRARALLRILAMHAGRPVHRDTLTAALWPDMTAAAATRSLHVALSSLRSFLDAEVPGQPDSVRSRSRDTGLLRRDGDAYLLALPSDGYADVAAFRAALEMVRRARVGRTADHVDALRSAITHYGGDLLPEDGPAEWVVQEREALRRQAADAAAELAATELATAELATAELTNAALGAAELDRPDQVTNVERAAAAAQRCVDIDPCHDTGWRLLIAAHQRAGNAAAAERARRRYADILVSLGLEPAANQPQGNIMSGRRTPVPRSPQAGSLPVGRRPI